MTNDGKKSLLSEDFGDVVAAGETDSRHLASLEAVLSGLDVVDVDEDGLSDELLAKKLLSLGLQTGELGIGRPKEEVSVAPAGDASNSKNYLG